MAHAASRVQLFHTSDMCCVLLAKCLTNFCAAGNVRAQEIKQQGMFRPHWRNAFSLEKGEVLCAAQLAVIARRLLSLNY